MGNRCSHAVFAFCRISNKKGLSVYPKRPRCSVKIFTPSRTRMVPPKISAFFPSIRPNRLPMAWPTKQQANVITAIKALALQIFTERAARLTPTARASMLVATACTKIACRTAKRDSFPAHCCAFLEWLLSAFFRR